MRLSSQDLSQLDEEQLLSLPEDALRHLSIKLLNDLKEARERLEQNSRNSSRPPSSESPWEKAGSQGDNLDDPEEARDVAEETEEPVKPPTDAEDREQGSPQEHRKPGKQPGAQGFGRQQSLPVTDREEHIPGACACCGKVLDASSKKAWTAFDTVDIEWADEQSPGLHLTNTRHTFYEVTCGCGHITRQEPYRPNADPGLPAIQCSEWRLVGPGLASLIICLAYRMRLSRQRIQEFLSDWLGLQLSVGTINNTLHESGSAAMPLEEALLEHVVDSRLLHVDETSWVELSTLLWLWVFSTDTVTVYWIAYRSSELIANILGHTYRGWLMSDGYQVYRKYPNRLRCWAHLIRKATGLEESYDEQARQFGKETRQLLERFISIVREAREHPPNTPLTERYQATLIAYRRRCEHMTSAAHAKTRALAKEMLNDWDAIFQVLNHPSLPLTNNDAERALRHWVILRRISYGTRTEAGSRVFAILISVIETCRKRQQSPWPYLAAVIHCHRSGNPIPALPSVKGSE